MADPANPVEGRVLPQPDPRLAARITASRLSPPIGSTVTRAELARTLGDSAPPDRLFYVGHVSHVALSPGSTGILLSDSGFVYGRGAVVARGGAATRPLTAADLIEGTLGLQRYLPELEVSERVDRAHLEAPWGGKLDDAERPGAEIWPMPPRVVLVACDSGGDLRDSEPFGLATAIINAGAAFVAATKWTLLTDYAVQQVTGEAATPLVDLVIDLDDATTSEAPFAAVAALQLRMLELWRTSGEVIHSPLFWAAVSCYDGSERRVVPYEAGAA